MPRLAPFNDIPLPVQDHPVFYINTKPWECKLAMPDRKAAINVKIDRIPGMVSWGSRGQL